MDQLEARLKCLEIASEYHRTYPQGLQPREMPKSEIVLDTAKAWSAFVIGDSVRESKSQGQRGRDDPK